MQRQPLSQDIKSSNEDVEPPTGPDVSKNSQNSNASFITEPCKKEYSIDDVTTYKSKTQTIENKIVAEIFDDSFDVSSKRLVEKSKRIPKRNSESEISGSESDSDSPKNFFMKSDSDTSLETVVDKQDEIDLNDTDTTLESVVDMAETASESPSIKEESVLLDEALEMKTDCDSGFSSQVDMSKFTADVMTLRHEIPSCSHSGTESVTSPKQIYFSTNEGSIITFEYTIHDEILGNFDKFNNTCIDLVKKDCPNKMAQLVYQAGLKALNNDHKKYLCCVFMLDNDNGQIDKLFESAKDEVPRHAETDESQECSHSPNDVISIIEQPDILNKAIIKLLPDDNNINISGSLDNNLAQLVLSYEDFSSEANVRAKDLSSDDEQQEEISYLPSEYMENAEGLQTQDILKSNDELSKITEPIQENVEKALQHLPISSNNIPKINVEIYNLMEPIQENVEEALSLPINLNKMDVKEKIPDEKFKKNNADEDILKSNHEMKPVQENVKETLQQLSINSNKMIIKEKIPHEKSNKNNEKININMDKSKTATINKTFPPVEIIGDFSKLIIGSVGKSFKNSKETINKKKSNEYWIQKSSLSLANSLEDCPKIPEIALPKNSAQNIETKNSLQSINQKMSKSEELCQEKTSIARERVKELNLKKKVIESVLPSDKNSSENQTPLNIIPKEISRPKGNKLLEKTLTEKFHTVNHILCVKDNTVITKTSVNQESAAITDSSLSKNNEISGELNQNSDISKNSSSWIYKNWAELIKVKNASLVNENSAYGHCKSFKSIVETYEQQKLANSLKEKESQMVLDSTVSDNAPKLPETENKEAVITNKAITPEESVKTNNANAKKDIPSEIEMLAKLPYTKMKPKRSLSCSKLSDRLKVTFLSTNNQKAPSVKDEGSESCSEISDESSVQIDETKPQFVRSAIHLLSKTDPPYTPYKIVWIKGIIKRIDKIGILECNVDIPSKIRPKLVNNTDANIRPVIPRTNTQQFGGLIAGGVDYIASASNVTAEDLEIKYLEEPINPVSVWTPPPRDEYGNISVPKKICSLNAGAQEYKPVIYRYKPSSSGSEFSPDVFVEFKPDIVNRPYRTGNPYDIPPDTRLLTNQQIPFLPGGVYVSRNGGIRLNFRNFISVDITVDLAVRVTYPFSNIHLALSHNGKFSAMVHPYGRVYQYHDVVDADIYDGYTGVSIMAKITESAVYFSNNVTNKVYLVDKYGTHRNHNASFFQLEDDFTPTVLLRSGRSGSQFTQLAVDMLTAAKFETCGLNHIIIIKNIKIIQYPSGNLSIFRYDRRDHLQICPNEGHCKISTPNVLITGTMNIINNKPHVFIRKDDKRVSFAPEKFFARTEGQTAGYDASNRLFIDYPI